MADRQVVDGFVSLVSGVHTDLAPELLESTFFSRGINLSCRNGLIKTRPGFAREEWRIPAAGTFQGAEVWSLNSGDRIVSVVSGRVYVWTIASQSLTDLGVLLGVSAQVFMCQVDRFFILQDGTSTPVVLEETEAGAVEQVALPVYSRNGQPDDPDQWTVPLWEGTVMAFVHGRLHLSPTVLPYDKENPPVSLDNGRPYFLSGDIALPGEPEAALYFTETEYLSGGGAHGLPQEMGYVTALSAYRNSASGTGYGPLVVFARKGVCAFDVSVPRTDWATQQLGQVLFFGAGTVSPWSVLPVNNDIMFRGRDGLRSLSYTASQVGGSEGTLTNLPLATELGAYFRTDEVGSLPFVSSAYCNNRFFMTVGGSGRTFEGLAVMDMAPTAAYRGIPAPMFLGVWQLPGSRKVVRVMSAERSQIPTLYVVADDRTLWRLDEDATDDAGTAIRARLVTRGMTFNSPVDIKNLQRVELGLQGLLSSAAIAVKFRPVGYPLWGDFATRAVLVSDGSLQQLRRKVVIPLSAEGQAYINAADSSQLYKGAKFQFLLEWEGSFTVDFFRVIAVLEMEGRPAVCDETTSVAITAGATAGTAVGEYLE